MRLSKRLGVRAEQISRAAASLEILEEERCFRKPYLSLLSLSLSLASLSVSLTVSAHEGALRRGAAPGEGVWRGAEEGVRAVLRCCCATCSLCFGTA